MNTATVEATELETLISELRGNPEAESASRIYYGRFLFCLDLNQAREILKAINGQQESTPVQSDVTLERPDYTPGHCFECGAECGRSQCQACKHSMTRGEYNRTYGQSNWDW